jgi:ATPase subunit of ABC transporter with duplicated ATPase domains
VGSIAVSKLAWRPPGGDELFRDVSFRVGNGDRVALVGANGVGKSTLLKLITGDLDASEGTISVDGELGVMHQLVGTADHPATNVRELLVSIAPHRLRHAAERMDAAEQRLADDPMAYADALASWGDAGGYDLEVTWDECVTRAVGESFDNVAARPLRTFSGGEQKRLALEALLRSEFDILVLDEPDNFLDVPAKRWLEAQLNDTRKTVLFISHDRELLAATATKIVTVEAWGAWTHGGSFADYADAKARHDDQREHDRALYDDERRRLEDYVKLMRERAKISEAFAPKLKAAETKLRHFVEKNERPPEIREQRLDVRLRGSRTGKRAVICERLEIAGLTDPFDLELWYGERVAVLGGNGVGKSHFLRLLHEVASIGREPGSRGALGRIRRCVPAGRRRGSRPVPPDPRTSRMGRTHAGGDPLRTRRRTRTGDGHAASLRAPRMCAADLRDPVRRSTGTVPDPPVGAVRRHVAAARRADGQPRPGLGRSSRGRARPVRRHRGRGHPRPMVPAWVRPLRRVRPRLHGHRPHDAACSMGVGDDIAGLTPDE